MEADKGESEAGWKVGAPGAMFTAHEYIHRCESHECATNTSEMAPCCHFVLLSALLLTRL